MNTPLPTTIDAYLEALRAALAGADPALLQDALYDAEEFLRSELAEQSGKSEAEVIAAVAGSYGAPDEVAAIYRDTEYKVRRAIEPPKREPRTSLLGRFFGVAADPRAYGAVFYMLLSMATGIFYFTFVVTGLSLSAGFAVLIIGIPFFLLFLGLTRECCRWSKAASSRPCSARACRGGRCIPTAASAGWSGSRRCSPTGAPGRRSCTSF